MFVSQQLQKFSTAKFNKNEAMLWFQIAHLYQKLVNQEYVIDKSGSKLVELINAYMIFDPSLGHHLKIYNPNTGYVFRQTNEEYVKIETDWHESMQLNIDMVDHVKIWQQVSSNKGQINSNYGWCVFHPDNGSQGKSQFEHVAETLKNQASSRQALIIYTRPTMHTDSKRDGMSDFLCTISNQFFIRDGKLLMNYTMKGQDLIHGLFNNYPWSVYVYNKMYDELLPTYPELQKGIITFMVGSLHIYERHFKRLERLFRNQ